MMNIWRATAQAWATATVQAWAQVMVAWARVMAAWALAMAWALVMGWSMDMAPKDMDQSHHEQIQHIQIMIRLHFPQ